MNCNPLTLPQPTRKSCCWYVPVNISNQDLYPDWPEYRDQSAVVTMNKAVYVAVRFVGALCKHFVTLCASGEVPVALCVLPIQCARCLFRAMIDSTGSPIIHHPFKITLPVLVHSHCSERCRKSHVPLQTLLCRNCMKKVAHGKDIFMTQK